MNPFLKKISMFLSFASLLLVSNGIAQAQKLSWVQETAKAGWQARDSQGEVVYKNKLWVLGGWFNSYAAPPPRCMEFF